MLLEVSPDGVALELDCELDVESVVDVDEELVPWSASMPCPGGGFVGLQLVARELAVAVAVHAS